MLDEGQMLNKHLEKENNGKQGFSEVMPDYLGPWAIEKNSINKIEWR